MAKTSTGVYIGKKYVNAVVLSGSFKKPTLLDQAKVEIKVSPDETYPTEEKLDKKITEAINSVLSKLKIKSDKIFSALPEAGIMLRHFDMPLLPRSEQIQAIKFEARKYIPFKVEDVFSDFKVINIFKEKKRMSVLFVAAQKPDVELQLKSFKNAGINIAGIDIASFSLLRALNIGRRVSKDKIIALLQLGIAENLACVNIVETNYPIVSRDISIAQYKETLAEKLISELRLSFDYYKRKGPYGKINKLIICGKEDIADLNKRLSEELNIAVEIMRPSNLIKGIEADSVGAIIATGAAMNGLGRDIYGVNLLPEYVKAKKLRPEMPLAFAVIISALAILFTFMYSAITTSSAKLGLNAVLNKARGLPAATEGRPVDALEKLIDKRLKTITILKALLTERIYLTDKLNRIAADMPEGVWITSFEASKPVDSKITLSINGNVFLKDSTRQMDRANQFLKTLKKDKVFMKGFGYCESGNLSKLTIDEYEVTSYSIQCGSRKQ